MKRKTWCCPFQVNTKLKQVNTHPFKSASPKKYIINQYLFSIVDSVRHMWFPVVYTFIGWKKTTFHNMAVNSIPWTAIKISC